MDWLISSRLALHQLIKIWSSCGVNYTDLIFRLMMARCLTLRILSRTFQSEMEPGYRCVSTAKRGRNNENNEAPFDDLLTSRSGHRMQRQSSINCYGCQSQEIWRPNIGWIGWLFYFIFFEHGISVECCSRNLSGSWFPMNRWVRRQIRKKVKRWQATVTWCQSMQELVTTKQGLHR